MPVITIYHKGGRVELIPQGYEGTTCHQATRPYEDARRGIGKTVEGEEGVAQGLPVAQQQKAGR